MYIDSLRKKKKKGGVHGLKVNDYMLLTVSRLAVVLLVYGDGTNNILALLLCLPRGSSFLEATKLASASAAICNYAQSAPCHRQINSMQSHANWLSNKPV